MLIAPAPPGTSRRGRRKRPNPQDGNLVRCSFRTVPENLTELDEWAEQEGFTRSAALCYLLRQWKEERRIRSGEASATLGELSQQLYDLRDLTLQLLDDNRQLKAMVSAAGEVAAIAPLILAHWQSSELGIRESDETPEQAEERMWNLWSAAGAVEWDARRRRVAPTEEERALDEGSGEEPDPEDLAEPETSEATDTPPADEPAPAEPVTPPETFDPDDGGGFVF